MCDTDPTICDTCSKEGAKFDKQQSKCIVGDDGEENGGDDGGGLSVGAATIGELATIQPFVLTIFLLNTCIPHIP